MKFTMSSRSLSEILWQWDIFEDDKWVVFEDDDLQGPLDAPGYLREIATSPEAVVA